MAYVKPEDRDTVWYIWNEKYLCSIPHQQTRSIEEIRLYGTIKLGIERFDREIQNEWIDTYLTINEMIELNKAMVPISVINPKDCEKIYQRIMDHLNIWKTYLERSIHKKDAPIDDLIQMDNFAGIVYPHAKKFFTDGFVESLVQREMMGLRTAVNILPAMKPPAIEDENVSVKNGIVTINGGEPEQVHESMVEFFVNHLDFAKAGKKW